MKSLNLIRSLFRTDYTISNCTTDSLWHFLLWRDDFSKKYIFIKQIVHCWVLRIWGGVQVRKDKQLWCKICLIFFLQRVRGKFLDRRNEELLTMLYGIENERQNNITVTLQLHIVSNNIENLFKKNKLRQKWFLSRES